MCLLGKNSTRHKLGLLDTSCPMLLKLTLAAWQEWERRFPLWSLNNPSIAKISAYKTCRSPHDQTSVGVLRELQLQTLKRFDGVRRVAGLALGKQGFTTWSAVKTNLKQCTTTRLSCFFCIDGTRERDISASTVSRKYVIKESWCFDAAHASAKQVAIHACLLARSCRCLQLSLASAVCAVFPRLVWGNGLSGCWIWSRKYGSCSTTAAAKFDCLQTTSAQISSTDRPRSFICCCQAVSIPSCRWVIVKEMQKVLWRTCTGSKNCQNVLDITSSTAQGGGGSFKNRKPIGDVGCCESGMAERSHWLTERWLELCLLEWLQWLQWSPLPHLLDVVWCTATVVVVVA